ncbi:MAG: Gfo/Idh/MocA family oxidoreductase [Rhodococcus sp. (in: high G+C Gram-positive bacteria)]|nr:MAG: Gfo/Idh/MocA family oxidoreductase [Rhodococcus sp. (in: high G+C Gram-positive bacteria)]
MTSTPVRIGIIGAGRMGTQHAGFIARDENAVLVGVADPQSDLLSTRSSVPHYRDHHELLEKSDVDAVIIANPNNAHVDTALDCIHAGIPALLEKPVAVTFAEATRLTQAVREKNAVVLVGHHRRHHPAVAAAREIILGGGIGQLVAVNGVWMARKPDDYFEHSWHREKGAGVMLINLVHDLDLMRHMCGEITAVQAVTSNMVRGHEVEDTAAVIVTFASGAVGTFTVSDATVAPWGWDQVTEDDPTFPYRPDTSCYSIAGTEGSLAFPQLKHYYYGGRADWTQPLSARYDPRSIGDSYTNQMAHFISVVRGETAPLVTVEDAAATLALIEAAHNAAETGTLTTITAQESLV